MSAARPPSGANHSQIDTSAAVGESGSGVRSVVAPGAGVSDPPSAPGFVTGRLLGCGGSASVWLVTDSADQRFALKVSHRTLRPREPFIAEPSIRELQELRPVRPMPGRRARRTASSSWPSTGPGVTEPGDELSMEPAVDRTVGPERSDGVHAPAEGDAVLRELRLLQLLRHEHLVLVHGVIESDRGPALLMDLAAGGSLLELVRSRGPLPIAEVVTTLAPVAQALGYLHEAGAMHGDITPGNILFTHEGKPLLSDFGTGRLLGAEPLAMPGTPGFVDPANTTAYDSGIDVFALAAVTWFALTGRVPGPTAQRPPLALIVPEVPDALMHLIEDALSPDRERRPSAASFARTLLTTSSPSPINLVPAVHVSVLPELLTRRSESRPAEPRSRWGRLAARRGAGRRPTTVPTRDGTTVRGRGSRGLPRRSPLRSSRLEPGRGPRTADRRINDEYADGQSRLRRVLAVASGCTAVVLLVVGVALTVGGSQGPGRVLTEPVMQGEEVGVPVPSDDAGEPPVGAPSESGEPVAGASTDQQPTTSGTGGAGEVPAAEAAIEAEDPVAALQGLVDLRASAFGKPDPEVLRRVDVDGSPAMLADRGSVGALEQAGTGLRDLSIAVREARILTEPELSARPPTASLPGVAGSPDDVEAAAVRATMQISSYTAEGVPAGAGEPGQDGADATGAEPPPLMAAGQQELVFVLWNTAEGWRIHSVIEPW